MAPSSRWPQELRVRLRLLLPVRDIDTHENWVARIHPEDPARAEKQFKDAVAGAALDYAADTASCGPVMDRYAGFEGSRPVIRCPV